MRTRTILISGLLALPATYAASATDWQSRTIYQLVTDRFATPDGSSPSCDTSARKYCGGTYKGVINKLDYIQNMGFDAVWISPIAKNVEGETAYGEAFHGYWTEDPSTLNSHFGSEDDLKALSDELHKRNMYLMVDVVINHLVATQTPPQFSSFPSPFNSESSFHPQHFIQSTDYPTPPFSAGNQTAVEQGWLGDEKVPLVDINTEDQNIQNWWYDWIKNLVSKYSIDGVRIDTVKHIRQDFWTGFSNAAGVWSVGEVLANATEYVGPYTKFLPAVLDYPTWFPLINGFMTPDGNLTALAETYTTTQNTYGNGSFSGHVIASFLENHDQPRFGGQTKDLSLVKNAMAWVFTQDGVPILYYGQEQGYQGGEDPANREALWLSGYDESKPLVKHTQALNAARKAAASANPKFHDTPLKFLPTESKSSLVVSKAPLLALFSNGGTSSNPSWTVSSAGYSANEDLVDVVSCTKITADGSGGVTASSKQGLPMVLVPASSLPKGGNVCSDLATGNQASGASRSAFASVVGALGVAAFAWQFLL